MNELEQRKDYGQWGQQFVPPYCFEMAGKTLALVFDDYKAELAFLDAKKLVFTRNGAADNTGYWCLKASDFTYLVCFGLPDYRCITLIIDVETRLVTLDETSFDENEAPYKSAVDFGYVDEPGSLPPTARHAYSEELADNRFLWIYCDTYWHVESYTNDTCTHLCNYPDFNGSGPYKAAKIKDTMFYVMNGDVKESICMIYNLTNMTSVGRSVVFETAQNPIAQGAVGKFSETIEPVDLTIVKQ